MRSFSVRFFVIAIGFAICTLTRTAAANELLEFARCIRSSGATFYGAHWCPHCAKQKDAFGSSVYRLPYVECYRSGSRKNLAKCDHIKSYPTWEFGDGTVQTGNLSFKKLAALTNCPLP
jgi:hypothetical protein